MFYVYLFSYLFSVHKICISLIPSRVFKRRHLCLKIVLLIYIDFSDTFVTCSRPYRSCTHQMFLCLSARLSVGTLQFNLFNICCTTSWEDIIITHAINSFTNILYRPYSIYSRSIRVSDPADFLPPPSASAAIITTAPAPRLGQGRVGGHGRCSTYIPEVIHPSRGRFRTSAAALAAAAAEAAEVGMPEVLGPEERGPWRSTGAPEPSQRPGSLQTPDPAPALQTARQRPGEQQLIGSGETQCTGLGRECAVGCVIGLERRYW